MTKVKAQRASEPSYGDGLAIITVTYSPGDSINEMLASIPAATASNPTVILSDNGSTDGSVEAAVERFPFARLHRNPGNPGYGGAINSAVADLDHSIGWILVVNPDTEFGEGSVDALLAVAKSDPTIGSVGPLIVSDDGVPYPSARALPSFRTGVMHAVFSGVWPNNPWSRAYRQDAVIEQGRQVPTGWLSGACVLVRRVAFNQVGGFDDRYFMYFEDVDLGKSLGEAGWSNIYAPSARIMHIGGTTAARFPVRTLTAHHDSAYRYIAKKHPEWWLFPVRVAIWSGLKVRQWSILRKARRVDAAGSTGDGRTGG
jgi:N-acetylglucosaminyl-diphospho-decaprenol L-rhamnosyltransferase